MLDAGCIVVHRRKRGIEDMSRAATVPFRLERNTPGPAPKEAIAASAGAVGVVIDTSVFRGQPWITVSLEGSGETVSRCVRESIYTYGEKVVVPDPSVRRDSTPATFRKVA
jgi:hypothetical protein